MNPNPLVALNHLTVPVAMLYSVPVGGEDRSIPDAVAGSNSWAINRSYPPPYRCAPFAIRWSFFFMTSGVVKWSLSTDPIVWNLTGEFLFKDVVLLGVCAVLFLASLP
jgi:hypothetical protein